MENTEMELPGDVLIAFRLTKGRPRSITTFAELAGTNYTKIHRLESIRWGVDEAEWSAHFDMTDLDPFIAVGWLSVGDEWYQRFQRAFEWQAKVMQYGPAIYEEAEPKTEYAPISEEHLSAVIRAVLGKLTAELGAARMVEEMRLKRAEEKLYQGVRSTLEAVGLLLSEDEGPGEEVTRGVLQGLTEGADLPESPYLHTLRFAVRCASVIGRERLQELAGEEGQS